MTIDSKFKRYSRKLDTCEHLQTSHSGRTPYCTLKKKMKYDDKRCDKVKNKDIYSMRASRCGLKFLNDLKEWVNTPVTTPVSEAYDKLRKVMMYNII